MGEGERKNGVRPLSCSLPLPIIRKRITPAPSRRTAKGGGMARQAVIFFFLPKPLYIRHIQRHVKKYLENFLGSPKISDHVVLTFALSKRKHPHRKGDEKTISARWPTLFLGFIHLQIYNHEQTKNSPSGHPTRKKKLWIATSQSAEHPPNAAPPFAP